MVELENCIICNSKIDSISHADHENIIISECPRCGKFEYSEVNIDTEKINEGTNSALISYWLRNHQHNVPIKLTKELLNNILENTILPKPKEQADSLLLFWGNKAVRPSESVDSKLISLVALIGAIAIEDVKYHLTYLRDEGYIYIGSFPSNIPLIERDFSFFSANLTHKGWKRYYKLLHESKDSKTVFMAMKFGKPETDNLYKDVLKDAVKDTGFELRKLDDYPEAGLIDDRLRVEIRKAKFLIADLTHDNPGAYFEAGFAEGLDKKVIYICEKDKFDKDKTHFDTNHHLTILWDLQNSKEFAEQLKATIRATFPTEAKMED